MCKPCEKLDHIVHIEELLHHPDPFHIPYQKVQTLQLKLLQQLFQENRERILILRSLSDRKNVQSIACFEDAAKLLLSHTTYKSYPESFLDQGRWDRMSQWMAALTSKGDELKCLDVSGISSLEACLSLLDAHGFAVCHSSGSSGKPSFFPKSVVEQMMTKLAYCTVLTQGQGIDPKKHKMPVLCVSFKSGWSAIIRRNRELAQAYTSSPEAIEYLFNEFQMPSVLRTQQKMRRLAAEGKLSPDELIDWRKQEQERSVASAQAFQNFIQRSLAYKQQRIMVLGHTATIFQMAAKGLEMGLKKVFAPDSLVIHGGGKKGIELPEGYEALIGEYYGVASTNVIELYGMTERNSTPLVCEYKRKHCPPWEISLLLDREGQKMLNGNSRDGGTMTGRYAFIDLLAKTYWGGIVTGDQVTMSFDHCPCNREGPQILEVTRYSDLPHAPDEDKISCAAEMADYVFADNGVE